MSRGIRRDRRDRPGALAPELSAEAVVLVVVKFERIGDIWPGRQEARPPSSIDAMGVGCGFRSVVMLLLLLSKKESGQEVSTGEKQCTTKKA